MADTSIKLPDYDFESRYVQLKDGRMHYVDEGTGPVLLLLHGNPTWSFLYRHLIHGLKDRFRCIAPDHLGFGLSDKPKGADYSVSAHVRRLGEFVEKLGAPKLTPVVQDWGGPIGLSWAVRHKEQIERLVVMNTIGFVPDRKYLKFSAATAGALSLLALLHTPGAGEVLIQGLNAFVRFGVPGGIYNKDRKTREVLKGYLYPFPNWASRAGVLKFPREIPFGPAHPNRGLLADLEEGLRGWSVPALIVWGTKDPAFPRGLAKKFADLLPNHRGPVWIEDASHFLQEDRPEPIVHAVREFFA